MSSLVFTPPTRQFCRVGVGGVYWTLLLPLAADQ